MKIIYDTALTYDDITLVPQKSWIKTRKDISIRTKVSKNYYIDVPIIASPMDTVVGEKMIYTMGKLGGLAIMHRFVSIDEQIRILKSVQEKWGWESIRPIVGASIGVKDIDYENAIRLLEEAHVNIILIDIAHGHCEMMREMLSKLVKLKEKYKFDIIAGNVATAEATEDLIRWGADGIRCGIGGGSCCSSRIKAATGIPMITSINECYEASKITGIPIMADGGIRYEGDVAKAISAGADCVMVGSLLAGTDESPGDLIDSDYYLNSGKVKVFRGSASRECKIERGEKDFVEGVSKYIPYKGSVESVINKIKDGLRSAMSYSGTMDIREFKENSILRKVTNNGVIEASPHLK